MRRVQKKRTDPNLVGLALGALSTAASEEDTDEAETQIGSTDGERGSSDEGRNPFLRSVNVSSNTHGVSKEDALETREMRYKFG